MPEQQQQQSYESWAEWMLSQDPTLSQPINPLDFWLAVENGDTSATDDNNLGWSING